MQNDELFLERAHKVLGFEWILQQLALLNVALLFLMLGNLDCYNLDQWIEIVCSFPFIGFALMAYPAITTFFEVRRHRDQL